MPPSVSTLGIPYAIGYLDAVWQTRTGGRLFVSFDPASVARLTLACGGDEEFSSLMSGFRDVLGQVAVPGAAVPPQRGARKPSAITWHQCSHRRPPARSAPRSGH